MINITRYLLLKNHNSKCGGEETIDHRLKRNRVESPETTIHIHTSDIAQNLPMKCNERSTNLFNK